MRIYLPITNKSTGRHLFCQRLGVAFDDMSIDYTTDIEKPHDVSLHLTKLRCAASASKRVVRFDGVLHNIRDAGRNKVLRKARKQADGIIYQSKFAKQMCDEYLGKATVPWRIIVNGAPLSPTVKSRDYVITASRWRRHKRLADIVESFLLASPANIKLYVAGDLKQCGVDRKTLARYWSHDNIQYLGVLDPETLHNYVKHARAFIHLCWFDTCPNGVVEAIAAGVPVVCNNVGGTHELVRPSGGIVCDVDKPYDLKPVRLYDPPAVDRAVVASAVTRCCDSDISIMRNHVDISNIAMQYYDFLAEVARC